MKLKNFKLSNALLVSSFILSYPTLKALTSQKNRLLIFLDALTITSLMMLLVGVLYYLYLKGDFDSTRFFIHRATARKDLSYGDYIALQQEKRKDSFNYPLFLALFYLAVSYLTAQLFF